MNYYIGTFSISSEHIVQSLCTCVCLVSVDLNKMHCHIPLRYRCPSKQSGYTLSTRLIRLCKVCGCYSTTFLDRTPTLDWCLWLGVDQRTKNVKDTCLVYIGLHLQTHIDHSTLNSEHNRDDLTYVFNLVKESTNIYFRYPYLFVSREV